METHMNGYVIGTMLMKGRRSICYYSKVFHWEILNYASYDKEIYALVQAIKGWKHYHMGNEIVI